MFTISKYPVPIKNEFKLAIPRGSKILSFQTQRGVPILWIMENTAEISMEKRSFRLYGTGHLINEADLNSKYIGTTQQSEDPPLVWHLFEIKE